MKTGDFCFIQPGELHTLEGPAHTITPYIHLDVFHNPARERSFVVRSGRVNVSGLEDLMQPRLDEAAGVRVPTRFVPPHPAQFRDTMLKAIGIWQRRDFLGQLESQYLATGLILSMLRGYSRRSSESSEEPEVLNWITSYMSLHLSEPCRCRTWPGGPGFQPHASRRFSATVSGGRPTSSCCICEYSVPRTCFTTPASRCGRSPPSAGSPMPTTSPRPSEGARARPQAPTAAPTNLRISTCAQRNPASFRDI
jgi:hypothetical protein